MDRAGATLVTVVHVGKDQLVITADWIQECIKNYEQIDDVFQKQFLQAILFSGGRSESSISLEASALLRGFGVQWHHFLNADSQNKPYPGPYVLLDGYLHEPFRLYSDENDAFFLSTRRAIIHDSKLSIEAIDRKFLSFDDSGDNYGRIEIAVPSRLRSEASTRLPMSGIRVAVKDNFDLEIPKPHYVVGLTYRLIRRS